MTKKIDMSLPFGGEPENHNALAGQAERCVMRQLTAEQILQAVYSHGFKADDIENIGMDVIVDITTAIETAHGI